MKHFFSPCFTSTQKARLALLSSLVISVCPVIARPAMQEAPAVPAAAEAPATVEPKFAAVAASINVLILALDEADIKAARSVGTRTAPPAAPPRETVPAPLPAPAPAAPPEPQQEADAEPPEEAEAEPPQEAVEEPAPFLLPPPPPRPRVPASELEVPATANAADLPFWQAYAQRSAAPADAGRLIPNLPTLAEPLEEDEMEAPSRRPPGRAQLAAAPLRRALANAGIRDVLTSPLDGASVSRSVNAGRVSKRLLDALRFATGQILEAADEPREAGAEPSPLVMQARRTSIESATRIGLALGYRAVVVLSVAPGGRYSLLLVDTTREQGLGFSVKAEGDSEAARDSNAAQAAAAMLTQQMSNWPPFTSTDRARSIEEHMDAARAAVENNNLAAVQDHLNLAVSLDPSHAEAYILLGDVLQKIDPAAAAKAYQRAAEINSRNGNVWSKIAIVHTLSEPPDWVRTLQAATRAQELGYDSGNLRTAMAAAEFGRSDLFKRGGQHDQAEDAELAARRHLDRARELAPDDPDVTASINRLMARYLIEQRRYREAVQSLDLLANQYPDDLQTQTMYAQALEGLGTRTEDLFLAWARVWRLRGESEVLLDTTRYARVADGFDQRMVNLSKNVFQMTSGAATGALLRETALLQTERITSDMKFIVDSLRLVRPPMGRTTSDSHVSRLFAADLMQQALQYYGLYLETGQELNRERAVDLHRQAIENLNIARASSAR